MQKYVFIVSLIIVLFSCVQGYISSSISNVNAKKKKNLEFSVVYICILTLPLLFGLNLENSDENLSKICFFWSSPVYCLTAVILLSQPY